MKNELKDIDIISCIAYELSCGYDRYRNRKLYRQQHVLTELKRTGAKSLTFTVADNQDLKDIITTFKTFIKIK